MAHNKSRTGYLLLWGACRTWLLGSSRYLVGICMVTDGQWLDSGYTLTHSNCHSAGIKVAQIQFCSHNSLLEDVDERTVTTLSLPWHSTVTAWGIWRCRIKQSLKKEKNKQTKKGFTKSCQTWANFCANSSLNFEKKCSNPCLRCVLI